MSIRVGQRKRWMGEEDLVQVLILRILITVDPSAFPHSQTQKSTHNLPIRLRREVISAVIFC